MEGIWNFLFGGRDGHVQILYHVYCVAFWLAYCVKCANRGGRVDNNNNNNNNNHDDIYSAVIYGASHMREFTVVPLGQSRSAPDGRQLLGQAANLTFESACRLP